MDFYEIINSRHSIRDFANESIPKDIMERIVKAAYAAPANDHFRDWHYVVVTDKEMMKNVIEGVPKNLTIKDVDAMTFISDPVQKESYQIAVPKQYAQPKYISNIKNFYIDNKPIYISVISFEEGEQITSSKVSSISSGLGLSNTIPNDRRKLFNSKH